jgi:septum formation inhibitor MinC
MKIREVTVNKPLTPEQQRIQAMQAQVKRAQEAVKAERARQKIRSGQKVLASSNLLI